MTQPNRPHRKFRDDDQVWTPADWRGWIRDALFVDGEWTYDVRRMNVQDRPYWYAEHELTEAGR